MSSRFVITKGVDNTFVFTIKGNGTTLPIDVATGTFTAILKTLGPNPTTVITKTLTKETPTASGRVKLVLTAAEVAPLQSKVGDEVDRFWLLPSYQLVINCTGTANGDFIAKVDEVYVN